MEPLATTPTDSNLEECIGCGALVDFPEEVMESCWCPTCVRRYPPDLRKAVCDPFSYALGTTTGLVFEFDQAAITTGGEWLLLTGVTSAVLRGDDLGFCLERGVSVRIADIQWIADAPHGS